MSYMSLYRKWRPRTFKGVRGQDAVVTTLQNQIKTGKIGHAYLFTGTRGTGKTSVAKILAAAVNCADPTDGNPCLECESCKSVLAGNNMNVREIDAASNNGVDNVREIREDVMYPPTGDKYKVYIIDEAHMLSAGAFNALLKTLEEPPDYVIFILATTEAAKLPVTILSRCQRYDFHRISASVIKEQLVMLSKEEGIDAEDKALEYIARKADGAMRDALSLFDRCAAFYSGESITYDGVLNILGAVDTDVFSEIFNCITDCDTTGALKAFDRVIAEGGVAVRFFTDFAAYLRNLMLISVSGDDGDDYIQDITTENMDKMREDASKTDAEALAMYIREISESLSQLRNTTQQKTIAEITLIKLTRPSVKEENAEPASLQRIKALEQQMAVLSSGFEEIKQKGVQVMAPEAGNVQTVEDQDEKEQKKEKLEKLVKAMPEDLKKIVEMWDILAPEFGEKIAFPPVFNRSVVTLTEDGSALKIIVTQPYCYGTLLKESLDGSGKTNRELFDEFITERTGGLEVPVVIEEADGATIDPDIDIRSQVTMEIEPDKRKEDV